MEYENKIAIFFDAENIQKSINYGISAMKKNVTKLKKLLQD